MPQKILVDRVPTSKELEQMFADQQAADFQRARAFYGTRAGNPGQLIEVDAARDVARVVPPPVPPTPVPKAKARVSCPKCGRVFQYARRGMAAMQLARHLRAAHPEMRE